MNKKIGHILLVVNILLTLSILGYLIYTQNNAPYKENLMGSLRARLQNHEEFKNFQWEYPRVTLLTSDTLAFANQRGIKFYNNAKEGDYLLEFTGASIIYNYEDDDIIDVLVYETVPNDLLMKLTAHQGIEAYSNIEPEIIKITQQNLNNLQQQIDGIDESQIGNYIVSYQDIVLLYDYAKDEIVDSIRFEMVPQDLLLKLTAHEEVEQYKATKPLNIAIIKQENLAALQQQITNIDETHIGSYIISYPDNRIVIYNYADDIILMNRLLQLAET